MKLPVGLQVKFREEAQRYTVQASSERYAVCTKPFNPRKTVLYTIIDFEEEVRGTENLIFGMGAETSEDCEEMLERLTESCEHDGTDIYCDCRTRVSYRNRIRLDIQKISVSKHVRQMPAVSL